MSSRDKKRRAKGVERLNTQNWRHISLETRLRLKTCFAEDKPEKLKKLKKPKKPEKHAALKTHFIEDTPWHAKLKTCPYETD